MMEQYSCWSHYCNMMYSCVISLSALRSRNTQIRGHTCFPRRISWEHDLMSHGPGKKVVFSFWHKKMKSAFLTYNNPPKTMFHKKISVILLLLFPQRFRSDFNKEKYYLPRHYPIVCSVNLLSGSQVPDV